MELIENPHEIERYQYFERFHENLKALKKNAKRKSRQSFLRRLEKHLSHFQISTMIKFRPKLYLGTEEIFSLTDKFELENIHTFIEPKIINLPNLEKNEPKESAFFENNNLDFYQHLSIPVSSNCDLNLDAFLFTKNEYLFYNFDIYATHNISDMKLKVPKKT
jgi:hypothetical protein